MDDVSRDARHHDTPYARERQGQVFDVIEWIARWKERRGVDATQERLGLAMMAYFHGNPFGLRDTVALCGSERPLPRFAVAALVRLLNGLIDDVSPGRGHSTFANRQAERQIQFACWQALRSARKNAGAARRRWRLHRRS
jgi:hypothetical protein